MRHGRRTDFTSLNLLLEVIHTHVGPNVATQVDEDIVYAKLAAMAEGAAIATEQLWRK